MQKFAGADLHTVLNPKPQDESSPQEIEEQAMVKSLLTSTVLLLGLALELLYKFKNQVIDLNLIHKDIKLENIIFQLAELTFELVDFEYSHSMEDSENTIVSGTRGYMAPELGKGGKLFASDIFSLGIVLAEFFKVDIEYMEAYLEYGDETWKKKIFKHLDIELNNKEALLDLITEMLQKNPQDRPKIEACIDAVAGCLLVEKTKRMSAIEKDDMFYVHDEAIKLLDTFDKLFPDLLNEATILDRIYLLICSAINNPKFPDNQDCIHHFIEMLRIKELYGCNTKIELLNRLTKICQNYKCVLNEFNADPIAKEKFLRKHKIIVPNFEYLQFINMKLEKRKMRVSKFSFITTKYNLPAAQDLVLAPVESKEKKRRIS